MNVRKGLLRLWFAFAVVWTGLVAWQLTLSRPVQQVFGWLDIELAFEGYELQAPFGMLDIQIDEMFDAFLSNERRDVSISDYESKSAALIELIRRQAKTNVGIDGTIKLKIGDKTISVNDSFISMSPDQQNEAVKEIARQLGIQIPNKFAKYAKPEVKFNAQGTKYPPSEHMVEHSGETIPEKKRRALFRASYRAVEAKAREEVASQAKNSLGWAGLPFMLLGIGAVVGWIVRGFRT